ncbi:MAG: LacI family transcriptional regulator [Armatimonadetes bacterium]|nr:LacI family transcriptional regulator [Armatimonadota bacterium]
MPVTLSDIAERLNLSTSTVSRVLNGQDDPLISKATRELVAATAKEMGYRPNAAARALAKGRTNVVALWTVSIFPVFYSQVVRLCTESVKSSGYSIRVVDIGRSGARVGSINWPSDGVLAFDSGSRIEQLIASAGHPKVPIVNFGLNCAHSLDHVSVNLLKPSTEAMRHLISLGRKRIAYVAPTESEDFKDPRCVAYYDAMTQAGLNAEFVSFDRVPPAVYRSVARQTICGYVQDSGVPDALFCYDDETAIGACRGLHDLGLRIPEDVAVVGCNGIEETQYHNPPISTIIVPLEEMCRRAWRFLQNRMINPDLPIQEAEVKAVFEARGS